MKKKQENPIINLLFNIVIPVVILNNFSKYIDLGTSGPVVALIVALLFPIGYGIWDYATTNKKNYISLLGIINILLTGGLALLKLSPKWFAIKEAAFPLVIGLAVLVSAFTSKPLISLLLGQEQLFNVSKIKEKLKSLNTESLYQTHLKYSTLLFSSSFFISAILNYWLAQRIFKTIDPTLSETAQMDILNQQISDMTWQGYIVIALPLMFFTLFIIWFTIKGIRKYTGLKLEEILHNYPENNQSASPSS